MKEKNWIQSDEPSFDYAEVEDCLARDKEGGIVSLIYSSEDYCDYFVEKQWKVPDSIKWEDCSVRESIQEKFCKELSELLSAIKTDLKQRLIDKVVILWIQVQVTSRCSE
eukprot:scaffold161999_cov90-Attheya_sp.AAC.4